MRGDGKRYNLPWLAVSFLIAAAVVAGFLPGTRLWGINHLAYLPTALAVPVMVLAIIALCLSHSRFADPTDRLHRMFERPLLSGPARPLRIIIPLLTAGVLLWALRGSTTLLGDGSLVVHEGSRGIPNFRAPLTWLIVQGFNRLPGRLWSQDLETTYRVVAVLCGIGFLAAARWFAGRIGGGPETRFFWLSFSLSTGITALFAGYVENYPVLYAAVYLYMVAGLLSLGGLAHPVLPLVLALFIPALHVIGVLCLPSALVIAARGVNGRYRLPLVVGLTAVGAAALYLAASRGPVIDLLLHPAGPYGIFSPAHLADLANETVLVLPALPLILLVLIKSKVATRSGELLFLAAMSAPFAVFTLVANPGLGLARDWDLFSAGIWVPGVAAAYLAIRALEEQPALVRKLGYACLAIGLATTLPWLLVNHHRSRSVERFADILELYGRRSAYGYEILSDYWIGQGNLPQAGEALRRAIDLSGNPRYYGAMGNLLIRLERLDEAEYFYRQALARDSTDAWNLRNLGVYCGRTGRYREAEALLLKAVGIDPRFATAFGDLGTLYSITGRLPEARRVLELAVGLEPENPTNHLRLARVYRRMGLERAAVRALERALTLDPENEATRTELSKAAQGRARGTGPEEERDP